MPVLVHVYPGLHIRLIEEVVDAANEKCHLEFPGSIHELLETVAIFGVFRATSVRVSFIPAGAALIVVSDDERGPRQPNHGITIYSERDGIACSDGAQGHSDDSGGKCERAGKLHTRID